MKLHFMGKYNMDPESLPCHEHKPGAVAFKEPKNTKMIGIIGNLVGVLIIILLMVAVLLRFKIAFYSTDIVFPEFIFKLFMLPWGTFLAMLFLIFGMFFYLFARLMFFKEDVYMYTNFKNGLLLFVAPETMSKSRFIAMSLLPSVIIGFIPLILSFIFPEAAFFGIIASIFVGSYLLDFMNAFNAITQMPKGSRTYMYHVNSYWYMPNK